MRDLHECQLHDPRVGLCRTGRSKDTKKVQAGGKRGQIRRGSRTRRLCIERRFLGALCAVGLPVVGVAIEPGALAAGPVVAIVRILSKSVLKPKLSTGTLACGRGAVGLARNLRAGRERLPTMGAVSQRHGRLLYRARLGGLASSSGALRLGDVWRPSEFSTEFADDAIRLSSCRPVRTSVPWN